LTRHTLPSDGEPPGEAHKAPDSDDDVPDSADRKIIRLHGCGLNRLTSKDPPTISFDRREAGAEVVDISGEQHTLASQNAVAAAPAIRHELTQTLSLT
jgi:hypothetical protein